MSLFVGRGGVKSLCLNGKKIGFVALNGKAVFKEEKGILGLLLKNSKLHNKVPDFNQIADTQEKSGLFKTQDDFGESYYFRGIIENNYFKFANEMWRIIRINGNGSIRLIKDVAIGPNYFNIYVNKTDYLKFIYGNTNSTVLGSIDSKSNTTLYGWYNNNIKNTDYESYIDTNSYFIGDNRYSTSKTEINNNFTTTVVTYCGSYVRLVGNKTPLLRSDNMTKYYTPIGLITADEVSFAGGVVGTENQNMWLKGETWTISPYQYYGPSSSTRTYVFKLDSYGELNSQSTGYSEKFKPVINIKGNLDFEGDGTINNPYKIKNVN